MDETDEAKGTDDDEEWTNRADGICNEEGTDDKGETNDGRKVENTDKGRVLSGMGPRAAVKGFIMDIVTL